MNNVQNQFTIRDLENFSGIKAHTIRIWEKRYGLLSPSRTAGNQRTYALEDLMKLLNVKILYESGHKISKISQYDEKQMSESVSMIISDERGRNKAIDSLKIAMINFDQSIFERTYIQLVSEFSFRRVFLDVFIPLMEQIGVLWQMDSITPAHEHFITSLIQQKIRANIERVQAIQHHNSNRVFVLYLPMNEIHELGALFLHYELSLRGCKVIYLGQSVPLDNLLDLKPLFDSVTYVGYFTVRPSSDMLEDYVKEVKEKILNRKTDEFWAMGRKAAEMKVDKKLRSFKVFSGIEAVLAHLDAV